MTDALPPAIPAATLVIFRDAAVGPPELLMVERAKAMVFAAGALVFPGGRVDPGDHALAALAGPPAVDRDTDDGDAAARIAAIRETIEEAGLPIGLDPMPDADTLATLRAALHAGEPFGDALARAQVRLTPQALVPFARWRPAHAHARIFDTRFYLTKLPAGAPPASVDRTENARLCWQSARGLLDAADTGQVAIIYPTRRNLERLAQFASFDDAVADARRYPSRTITPFERTVDRVTRLCIPDDAGYPICEEILSDALRG